MSRYFTFTEGSRLVQRYLHDDSFARQGSHALCERALELRQPFFMQ